jgi:CubicO group peptidase (beta-lactamase class C family)
VSASPACDPAWKSSKPIDRSVGFPHVGRQCARREAEISALDRRAYSTAEKYLRFAQMLANGGELHGVHLLSPSSVKLMTSNLLPPGVPMHFDQPFAGVGYGMGVGIVLDPAHADFNGGPIGKGSFYWGGVTAPGSGLTRSTTSSSSAW